MSLLARSLLALAALVAVAIAEPDPFCGELILGLRTIDARYFELQGTGGEYGIPNKCSPPGWTGTPIRVGQHVVVCNPPNSKPMIIQVANQDPFHEVMVDCPSNTYGCENITVAVTQYCDYPEYPDLPIYK